MPDSLQFVQLLTLSNEECIERIDEFHGQFIFDSTLCAMQRVGVGACNGDSGSPLVVRGTLVGIDSWGSRPCANGGPDMFARMSVFVDWIVEQTGLMVL